MPTGIYNHRPHSEATRAKIKKANTGSTNFLGKKHSKNARLKMSKIKKANPVKYWLGKKRPEHSNVLKGEKCHFWKGGVTPLNKIIRSSCEYKLWRKSVFERDNYTCRLCGAKSGKGKIVVLNADHIKPFSIFPELRFAIDNGRTLCRSCHEKTDTWGNQLARLKKRV